MYISVNNDFQVVTSISTMITKRPDKRGNEDIRKTKISYDGLARVDGSARFSFGACYDNRKGCDLKHLDER